MTVVIDSRLKYLQGDITGKKASYHTFEFMFARKTNTAPTPVNPANWIEERSLVKDTHAIGRKFQ